MYRKSITSPIATSKSRAGPFKCYPSDKLNLAINAVKENGYTVRRAATEFGIPKSTFFDYVSGRLQFGKKSGPPRYLSDAEEEELCRFLVGCAKIGYARSRKQVLAIVKGIVSRKMEKDVEDVSISTGWWTSFRNRHPHLSLRAPSRFAYARAVANDPDIFEAYFDLLEETLSQNNLLDNPNSIFNCDESGFSLDPKTGKLVGLKGIKEFNVITSGDKSQLTVLACVCASGYPIPPFIIFDRKRLKPEHTVGEISGTLYGLSSKGWVDSDLFEEWFTHHFLLHVPPIRPLLLLFDGHSSHYQPHVVRKAAENGVILFCLPPHTTHIAQPLDRTCFSPLKAAWSNECQIFMTKNPGKIVNRYNFTSIFAKAWTRAMTPSNIVAGFRSTGVCPFNRYAILHGDSSADRSCNLSKATGLTYIPLFSPAPRRRHSFKSSPIPLVLDESTCTIDSLSYNSSDSEIEKSISLNDQTAKVQFTTEEEQRFKTRYENNYDLKIDERYNKWLKQREAEPKGFLSEFLVLPDPPKKPLKKCNARVLTSVENLQLLEAKEEEKRKKEELKIERKEEREKKRQEREINKQQKEKLKLEKKKAAELLKLKQDMKFKSKTTINQTKGRWEIMFRLSLNYGV